MEGESNVGEIQSQLKQTKNTFDKIYGTYSKANRDADRLVCLPFYQSLVDNVLQLGKTLAQVETGTKVKQFASYYPITLKYTQHIP